MAEIFVRHVELLGYEKRFFPTQHYVSLKTFPLQTELFFCLNPEAFATHRTQTNKRRQAVPPLFTEGVLEMV